MASKAQAEVVAGSALGLVEEQGVGGDAEAAGELAEDLQGGLGLAGLIAADLGDVDAGLVGEGLLGEALEAAEGDEAVGEGHLAPERVRRGSGPCIAKRISLRASIQLLDRFSEEAGWRGFRRRSWSG